MPMYDNTEDVISDVIDRVAAAAKVPEAVARQVERDARTYWGGERPYIRKAGESPRRAAAHERAARVLADFRRGEHIRLIARRYELSERHVRRLLGIQQQAEEPTDDPTIERPEKRRKRGHSFA